MNGVVRIDAEARDGLVSRRPLLHALQGSCVCRGKLDKLRGRLLAVSVPPLGDAAKDNLAATPPTRFNDMLHDDLNLAPAGTPLL